MAAWRPLAAVFYFESFSIEPENRRVTYLYTTDAGHSFTHELNFDFSHTVDIEALKPAAFALGMAELAHYWKAILAPTVMVKAGKLSKEQIAFWENLYTKGLGEFFYVNQIDFRGIVHFESDVHAPQLKPIESKGNGKALVPFGGGKDSLVTGEFLKRLSKGFSWFELEPLPFGEKLRDVSGVTDSLAMGRDVQKNFAPVIELVKQGAPNGHVPISASYMFAAVLAAKASGFSDVVMSLERSANVGNVEYLGTTINHQYSKSFEFEKAANAYIKKHIDPSLRMFSLLRPLYEIQIIREFAKHPHYFPYFISCNRGLKSSSWCGVCAKCAFMFAGLAAFLPVETVTAIFNKNLFEDESLIPLYKEMTGLGTMKPFDCVGTFEENLLALYLAGEEYKKHNAPLPPVLAQLPIEEGKKHLQILDSTTGEHLIPKDYAKPKIAIAGFGMEGREVYEYFKDVADITVFDDTPKDMSGMHATFREGLAIPADFEVVYKSPGIPTSKLSLASQETVVSTFAAILLSEVGDRTIGVTGTKGKSTVSSLIHHILKSAGRDVALLGNIGVADISLLRNDLPERIYVIELSSYQLEHVHSSPHVAVLTNLYPEHLNHHGSFELYKQAKLNIARFQNEDDFFINASTLPDSFKGKIVIPKTFAPFEARLLGEHNQKNCALAVLAVAEYGIPEDAARRYIATFDPLPMRLENVGTFKNITFYDDSLATIPEATLASIAALPKVDTLILGGEDRGISFESFASALAESAISTFITFPQTGEKMVTGVVGKKIIPVSSMEEAVAAAYGNTPEGGTVLLSNASPSFNMFKDYKDKSGQYTHWIETLGV